MRAELLPASVSPGDEGCRSPSSLRPCLRPWLGQDQLLGLSSSRLARPKASRLFAFLQLAPAGAAGQGACPEGERLAGVFHSLTLPWLLRRLCSGTQLLRTFSRGDLPVDLMTKPAAVLKTELFLVFPLFIFLNTWLGQRSAGFLGRVSPSEARAARSFQPGSICLRLVKRSVLLCVASAPCSEHRELLGGGWRGQDVLGRKGFGTCMAVRKQCWLPPPPPPFTLFLVCAGVPVPG